MKKSFLGAFLLLILFLGCNRVQFHQKERLSDRIMVFDPDAIAAQMHGNMVTPREATIGGFSSVGAGGCSCK